MKMKWSVLIIATCVAICRLNLQAQEATEKQKAFEEEQVRLAAQQLKASQEAIAAAQKMLTPEQLERRKKLQEAIAKTHDVPPLPPTQDKLQKTRTFIPISQPKSSEPALSVGERMQFRNLLMTDLMMEGTITTTENAALVNEAIDQMITNNTPLDAIAASAYVIAAMLPSEDEGIQTQSLMAGRTIDYTSNPYVLVNMAPFFNGVLNSYPWYSSDSSDPSLYWTSTPRTLVPTNGPAARTGAFVDGVSGYSALRNPTIQNHYDTTGSPVRHILAINYKLENTSTVAGMDTAYIDIDIGISGSVPTTNHVHYTLPSATTWTRNIHLINSMAKTNPLAPSQGVGVRYYEFWAVLVKNHYTFRPVALQPVLTIDPSIQWIPYWLPPIPSDFAIESVGNQVWVQWSTLAYPTNSLKLGFTTSLANTNWSTAIGVPVTYTNEVATAKFTVLPNTPSRFYGLIKP